MRKDHQEIHNSYSTDFPVLERLAQIIQQELKNRVSNLKNVDRVTCRAKNIESFMAKANKTNDKGELKYKVPLKEIQDKIGARIVVYYKTDVEPIRKTINDYFRLIEQQQIIPDDISKFGYEGFHMICKIPNTLITTETKTLLGDFFELQIKTLYQHAWSQSNHGLGYKPGAELKDDDVRLLAFIAAQSWGADKGLLELTTGKQDN